MLDDKLPVLDLYERRASDGEPYLTGAFGGVKIFIHPIKGASKDDRCWRLYLAPRARGVLRDRHMPTRATPPAPPPPSMAGRGDLTEALAAAGIEARYRLPPADDDA